MEFLLLNWLVISTAICIGTTAISWIIYRNLRTNLFKYIFGFWAIHSFHLIFSTLNANSKSPIIWTVSMLPWTLVYYFQWKVLTQFFQPRSHLTYAKFLYLVGFLVSFVIGFFSHNFAYVHLPVVICVSIIGIHMCWEYWQGIRKKKNNSLDKILLLLMIIFVVHAADYPILRPIPEFAIYGFGIYLFNIVGFAVILPTMAMYEAGEDQRHHLENLVKQRTEQLLQQSRLSALGEMAAGVAHEINNPLANILGRSEQVYNRKKRNDLSDNYLLDSMDLIQATSIRISKIIEALLDFSKQGLEIPYAVETIEKTISHIKVLCEEKFRFHGIKLLFEGDFSLHIKTRGPQISQVILNLLNNAFDAVENEPSPWVKVIFKKMNKIIRISVSDSGKGIPEANRDKIMQPFFTSKEIGKGTGLGLSISKGIVERHGGNIYLDTQEKVTTFVIELPATEEDA